MSEEVEEQGGGELDPRILTLILGVVALPSVLLAGFLWVFFQRWRIFSRFHQPVSNVAWLTMPLAAGLSGWVGLHWHAFTSLSTAVSPAILAPLYGALGLVGGFILCAAGGRKLAREPWLAKDGKHWGSSYKPRATFGAARRERKLRSQLSIGQLYEDDRAPLGLSTEAPEAVFRFYREANTHTLITGATGSGKSVTMRNLIYNDLLSGVPVFVIDFKRDVELAEKLAGWCADLGLSFKHFINTPHDEYRVKSNPAGPSFYDPLAGLSPDAKADMLLNMRKWDAAADFHRNNMQSMLTQLFGVLDEVKPFYGGPELRKYQLDKLGDLKRFETIIKSPNAQALTDLLMVLPQTSLKFNDFSNLVQAVTSGKATDLKHAYNIMSTTLANITATGYGRWLAVDERHEGLDLLALSETPGVVLFSINADEAKAFASAFGSVILQQMTNISGYRQAQRVADRYLGIYVDEFAVVNPETVKGLLERGRSAKVCVTLAIQSFQQVVTAAEGMAGEALLQGYIDTMNNFIIHAGINFTTAEYMSNIFGKEWRESFNISHHSSSSWFALNRQAKTQQNVQRMEREEWILDPTLLTKVRGPGVNSAPEAYYITKNSADPAHAGKRAVKLTALLPASISSNDVDQTYVMDVGPAAQEFVAEAKAASDAVLTSALVDNMNALGTAKTLEHALVPSLPKGEEEPVDDGGYSLEALSDEEGDLDLLLDKARQIAADPSPSVAEQEWLRRTIHEHKATHGRELKQAVLEGRALRAKPKQASFNAFEDGPPPGRKVPAPDALPTLPSREEVALPAIPVKAKEPVQPFDPFDQGF